MHDPSSCQQWLMQHIQKAIKIGSIILRMAYEMRQFDTRIQLRIEIQCSKYDAPSPVHARQINGWKHAKHKDANWNMPKN